jgi:hypothetical protein
MAALKPNRNAHADRPCCFENPFTMKGKSCQGGARTLQAACSRPANHCAAAQLVKLVGWSPTELTQCPN